MWNPVGTISEDLRVPISVRMSQNPYEGALKLDCTDAPATESNITENEDEWMMT